MYQGLTLDQAPPFSAPLRFFLTAPLFGILAGAVILWAEPEQLLNRYSPTTIALVHLMTLGFMTMIMVGAMQQMLPVIAGVQFPKPLHFAKGIHLLLSMGVLLLSGGFLWQKPILLLTAVPLLFISLGGFAWVSGRALLKVKSTHSAVRAMQLAIFALPLAVLLGSYLAVSHGLNLFSAFHWQLVQVHILFAFLGWVMLLIIGVSFQVIPMFYVTPPYPPFCRTVLAPFLIGISMLSALSIGLSGVYYEKVATVLYSLGILTYALTTLWQLHRRKRKVPEVTISYGRVAMSSLGIGVFAWNFSLFAGAAMTPLIAILLGIGFVVSLMNGMLYKIIPFLSWFHLNAKGVWDAPNVRAFIPEPQMKLQFWLHTLALLGMVLATTGLYSLFWMSGILFILSNSLLFFNLRGAIKIYQHWESQTTK